MIAGATPQRAARLLHDALQRAVSRVTQDVLIDQAYAAESELTVISRLRSQDERPLTLSLRHFYAVVSDASRGRSERWQARTRGYNYKLDDTAGREILAYHWHPDRPQPGDAAPPPSRRGRRHVAERPASRGAGDGGPRAISGMKRSR